MKIDFTLVIPTRLRMNLVELQLLSIKKLSNKPENIEIIYIFDDDDTATIEFMKGIDKKWPMKIITIQRDRAGVKNLNHSYYNYGASFGSGDVYWALGNDCVITSKDWDKKAKQKIKEFTKDNKDNLAYIVVNDGFTGQAGNCCFPMLTKESVRIFGGLFPIEFVSWGADVALYEIYENLEKKRIVDCYEEVALENHSYHAQNYPKDQVSEEVEQLNIDHPTPTPGHPSLVAYTRKLNNYLKLFYPKTKLGA